MENTENQNIEQQPETTQPADNGTQGGGKMFTQEEVNQIVKERLERERAKAKPPEPTEEEKRLQELTARENKLFCREYLVNGGHPVELLDVIDTSDIEGFKTKAEIIQGLLRSNVQHLLSDPAMDAVKMKVAAETGIPSELALRLSGNSEEDIRYDAEVLRGVIRKIKGPAPLASHDHNTASPVGSFGNAKHKPRQVWPFTD